MRQLTRFAAFSSLVCGLSMVAGGAGAAPQVLGLVASLRPTPMQCQDGNCRADLSAFCLQQPRPDPKPGTMYRPAPGTSVTLLVTGHDRKVRRVDAAKYLSFVDDNGFTSVTVRLKVDALAGMDVAGLAIEVGKDASLLPEPGAADADPQTPHEVALATGNYRQKAETYYDKPGRDADAIRLTNAMINDLQAGSRRHDDGDGHVLADVLSQYAGLPIAPDGAALAEDIHRNCVAKVDVVHQVDSMRSCLEGSHDILTTHVNIDFWNSLGGS